MEEKKEEKNIDTFNIRTVALEIGFSVAVPIVLFALLGRFLDKELDSSPICLLVGIGISTIVSTFLIFVKMRRYF